MSASESTPRRPNVHRVFSARLEEFLDQLWAGETPNAGRFCPFCYNPLPPALERCDHCGQEIRDRATLESLPRDIVYMYRQKQKRESLIVNSLAFFGLGLGLAIFLGMVAINVLYMEKAFWFFLVALVTFIIGSRLLAGIFGGIIGDELGYQYANKKLAEDWAEHVATRENQNRA